MPLRLIEYLPAIYQTAGEHSLLAHLLRAFEEILLTTSSRPGKHRNAIEDEIVDMARYFDPARAPADFLPWLADWVALSLRAGLTDERLRHVIAGVVPIYAMRGTRRGIVDAVPAVYWRHRGGCGARGRGVADLRSFDHRERYVPRRRSAALVSRPLFRRGTGGRFENAFDIARWVIELTKPAHTACSVELVRRRRPAEPAEKRSAQEKKR